MLQGMISCSRESEVFDEKQTILDCSPAKEGFYIKCGYEKAGLEMHCYYDAGAQKHRV